MGLLLTLLLIEAMGSILLPRKVFPRSFPIFVVLRGAFLQSKTMQVDGIETSISFQHNFNLDLRNENKVRA